MVALEGAAQAAETSGNYDGETCASLRRWFQPWQKRVWSCGWELRRGREAYLLRIEENTKCVGRV